MEKVIQPTVELPKGEILHKLEEIRPYPSDPEPFPGVRRASLCQRDMGDQRIPGEYYITHGNHEPLGKILKLKYIRSKFCGKIWVNKKFYIYYHGNPGLKNMHNYSRFNQVGIELLCWHRSGYLKIFITSYSQIAAYRLFTYKHFKLGAEKLSTKRYTFYRPRIIK